MRLLRQVLPAFLAAGCSMNAGPGVAQEVPAFEQKLEALRRRLNVPGMSAAIARGQQVIWIRGFGYADVERDIRAADTTSYHLASLTKTFASTVVMRLVEEGRLNLDAPVSEFGIALTSHGVVRVRHLLTHTSEGDPGSGYRYNSDRFGLLDQVIVRASNESFGQLLERLIREPLALRQTAPNVRHDAFTLAGLDLAGFTRNLAQGYESNGHTPVAYPGYFGTAAGLIGSAPDVARYSMAIDRGAFLRPETQRMAFTATVSPQGDTLP